MFRRMTCVSFVSCLVLVVSACDRVVPEGEATLTPRALASTSQTTYPGYQHVYANSRLNVGGNSHPDVSGAYSRWVGDEGAFATQQKNGVVLASSNAGSPALISPPYPEDESGHNQMVLAYFERAGLPADQVLRVGATYQYSGMTQRGVPESSPVFSGITSSLTRSVGGYVVVDSIAEASFNANGEVTQESVYWPAIPQSVVIDAQAIDATLADGVAGPDFLASLPAHQDPGRVVIRHTSAWAAGEAFTAVAAYDIHIENTTRHFDAHASEFRLPQEEVVLSSQPTIP